MLISYLNTHFLSETDFAAAAGWALPQLHAAIANRLVPGPSYRVTGRVAVGSFLANTTQDLELRYHLAAHLDWVRDLRRLGILHEAEARALFLARYDGARRAFVASPLGAALIQAIPDALAGFDAGHADRTWGHFLDGVYGSCTRDGAPETVFCKQIGVEIVERMIADAPQVMAAADKSLLARAVDFLDSVASGFAPHERALSSRQRCIDDVRARYLSGPDAAISATCPD